MSTKPKKTPSKPKKNAVGIHCCECKQFIPAKSQALFVEEEVGRFFCQESCIVSHFADEIENLEKEYGRQVSATDLSSEERERYAHLRWNTLENPDEVWREKDSSGDHRYTLVSKFNPEQKNVWGVAVCLMLRGEPSFLFIAFVTSDLKLVEHFRKGEKLKIAKREIKETDDKFSGMAVNQDEGDPSEEGRDRLAEPWTEFDSVRASIISSRKPNDIPPEDFGFYQKCLEETLQEPTELWSYTAKASKKVYHFIREYEHDSNYWYVVMAKDTADDTQIEIIDAFPTKDKNLVEMCRHGKKEELGHVDATGESDDRPLKRTVH